LTSLPERRDEKNLKRVLTGFFIFSSLKVAGAGKGEFSSLIFPDGGFQRVSNLNEVAYYKGRVSTGNLFSFDRGKNP
jgi:hypothetical protein